MVVNSIASSRIKTDAEIRSLRSVIVLAPQTLGECAQMTGIISWVVDFSPTVRISVVCNEDTATIFSAAPNADEILALPRETGLVHRAKLYWFGLRRYWDVVFDLRGDKLARGWLTHARQSVIGNEPEPDEHPVEWFCRAAGFSGAIPPTIWFRPKHLAYAQQQLPSDRPVIGIGACADRREERWPVAKYADLMKSLHKEPAFADAVFVIYGGSENKDAIVPLKRAVPRDYRINLVEDADVLSSVACLSQTDIFIGDASTYLQLAVAAGVPCVAALSHRAPLSEEPWGHQHRVIRGQLNPFDAAPDTPSSGMLGVGTVQSAVMEEWTRIIDNAGPKDG